MSVAGFSRQRAIGRLRFSRSAVVALAGLAGILGVPSAAHPQAAPAAAERWLVMPFENPSREPRLYWLSEAASVLLADDLTALGAVAIERDERLAAFEHLQVPPIASLSHATVIRIGQLLGATQVVIGSLTLTGDQIEVRAWNIRLDAGSLQAEIRESGPVEDLFAVFERLARRLLPHGSVSADVVATLHPSPGAFENYVKGLVAESTSSQVSYLEAALRLDPGFDRARLALWSTYREAGESERALAAVTAVAKGSPWYRQARFNASLSQIQLKRYDAAVATLTALADQSATGAVLNNLGVVQLRRGVTATSGRATDYFTRAAAIDPDDPDYHFNLGYACWIDRNLESAIHWLREAVRRNPSDGEAHAVLGAALQAAGAVTEAAREKELARQLSSSYAAWERPQGGGEAVPRGLARLRLDLDVPRGERVDSAILTSKQRDQLELAAFYLDRGRRLFDQKQDREAEGELRRTLYLAPYQAEAHLLLGRILSRTGRMGEAIDAFKISLWSEETVAAHLALADAYLHAKNIEAARGEAQRALAMAPDSADAKGLLDRLAAPLAK
jgi:tetratricopeptide (TPR) repeat protein